MSLRAYPRWLAGLGLVATFTLSADVINDGTTVANLVQLSNVAGTGDAVVSLGVEPDATLKATQDGSSDFPLQTVWYAANSYATSGVYTVSAEFQPAQVTYQAVGGVMGWLNLTSSNGIAFQVVPEAAGDVPDSFQVAVVDFSAIDPDHNVTVNHLFNLDGSPAVAGPGSAWTDLGTVYSPTNLATFQLEFSTPSAADLLAVTNATAHMKAKVFQGVDATNNPIQVSATIELLTDLPLPAGVAHRFGYSAVWSDIFSSGEDIGFLDNLSASGGIGIPPNTPPTVTITNPVSGAIFSEPASITIDADAADSDGTVDRVDFFQGGTLIGVATNSPYSLAWNNVAAGTYVLTAVATDNLGLAMTSAPVNITVTQSSGTGPQMTFVQNGGSLQIFWGVTGYQLQMKTNLSSTEWMDVGNTVNAMSATVQISGGDQFFRLVRQGAPAGPSLSIQQTGSNTFSISWQPALPGYHLESTPSLSPPSWTGASTNNPTIETVSGSTRFYRLTNPTP